VIPRSALYAQAQAHHTGRGLPFDRMSAKNESPGFPKLSSCLAGVEGRLSSSPCLSGAGTVQGQRLDRGGQDAHHKIPAQPKYPRRLEKTLPSVAGVGGASQSDNLARARIWGIDFCAGLHYNMNAHPTKASMQHEH